MKTSSILMGVMFFVGLVCGVLLHSLVSFNVPQPLYGVLSGEGLSIQVLVDREYYRSLLLDLKNANESVKVVMFSVVYDENDTFDWANDLIRELVHAKRRGLNVSVVIEHRTYHGYMDDNVPAYDYLLSNGVDVRLDNEPDTDHLKLVMIDDEIVYLGSHNWSESALYHNREVSVKIVSKEIAQLLKNYLKNNYGI